MSRADASGARTRADEGCDASRVRMPFAPGALPRNESFDRVARDVEVPDARASPVKTHARGDATRARGDETKPRVMLFHCGGTLGMGMESFELVRETDVVPRAGGKYRPLGASKYLLDVHAVIPELSDFARLDVEVLMNKDSSEMDGADWVKLARALHERRDEYSAFVVAHGTDTMAYAASALSLMLVGFGKPIVLTGSQLPLSFARSDARQNLIDALTCCCASRSCGGTVDFAEVAICFGGKLIRGNRASKTSATVYAAFSSPSYPTLARLGVGVDWNHARLLRPTTEYAPRFELNANVIRVPVIPGMDLDKAYGDLYGRGVRGIILEAFGVGNFPQSLVPWLTSQAARGLQVYLSTQCQSGELRPELYAAGLGALAVGAKSGPVMTSECAVVKMMLHIANPELELHVSHAGEAGDVDFCDIK